jgi:anaerobic dimethyl sulfoxide reductase subunit C (anchor subunit)
MLKEWPLVAFTIGGQMAVGILLLTGLPWLLTTRTFPNAEARGLWLVLQALIFGLLVVAASISFFHLHRPFRARRVLTNLRTSWLSREIFFELCFMTLVALETFLAWKKPEWIGLFIGVVVAVILAGILFLVSMSKLYMLQTVPPWNQAYTPISFVLTTLILGALALALVWRARVGQGPFPRGLLEVTFSLIVIEIVLALLLTPRRGAFGYRPGPSLRPPGETPRILHVGRLALLAVGLVLIGAAIMTRDVEYRAATGSGVSGLLVVAFVLVLASEVAGRFLFYGLLTRPGR